MDMQRKLEIVQMGLKSISTHEDIDAAVRLAALTRIEKMIGAERDAINARVQSQIEGFLPAEQEAAG